MEGADKLPRTSVTSAGLTPAVAVDGIDSETVVEAL